MDAPTVEVAVGRVGRAHGVRGDVAVEVRTDEPERRFTRGAALRTERHGVPGADLVVEDVREHSGRLLVRFRGVADRTAAEALGGTTLLADVDPAERPDDDEEFYDHQLVGLTAVDAHEQVVGEVGAVLHLPGQDTLSIRRPDGTEVLVPFARELVPEVDLAARRLVLADRPGLLDPDAAEVAAEVAADGAPGTS